MKTASASAYAYQGKINSIDVAIVRVLGYRMVTHIAVGMAVSRSFRIPEEGPLGVIGPTSGHRRAAVRQAADRRRAARTKPDPTARRPTATSTRTVVSEPVRATPEELPLVVVHEDADLLVIDTQADGLAGVPPSHAIDALVFATDAPAWREVWVAGQRRVADGRHRQQAALRSGFADAMAALWPQPG